MCSHSNLKESHATGLSSSIRWLPSKIHKHFYVLVTQIQPVDKKIYKWIALFQKHNHVFPFRNGLCGAVPRGWRETEASMRLSLLSVRKKWCSAPQDQPPWPSFTWSLNTDSKTSACLHRSKLVWRDSHSVFIQVLHINLYIPYSSQRKGKNSLWYSKILKCCVLIIYLVSNHLKYSLETNWEKTQDPVLSSGHAMLCPSHRNETIFFALLFSSPTSSHLRSFYLWVSSPVFN